MSKAGSLIQKADKYVLEVCKDATLQAVCPLQPHSMDCINWAGAQHQSGKRFMLAFQSNT